MVVCAIVARQGTHDGRPRFRDWPDNARPADGLVPGHSRLVRAL
jgi:hypothetical protein